MAQQLSNQRIAWFNGKFVPESAACYRAWRGKIPQLFPFHYPAIPLPSRIP